jgi:hypothetical protein
MQFPAKLVQEGHAVGECDGIPHIDLLLFCEGDFDIKILTNTDERLARLCAADLGC